MTTGVVCYLAVVALLLGPSGASAAARGENQRDWQLSVAAEYLAWGAVLSDPFGPDDVYSGHAVAEPCKRRARAWRCLITLHGSYESGRRYRCRAVVLVKRGRWRYPPALFRCPAEWRPIRRP